MTEKVTTYLPAAAYTEKADTIPRTLFDQAAEKINTEIAETNLIPLPTGMYSCETDYSGFIVEKMIQYIEDELIDAEGRYKTMLQETQTALNSGNFKTLVSQWETLFLQSQLAAIATFNANVNPSTGLPYVPPTAPYAVTEAYGTIETSIGAPPGILGTAILNYMTNTYNAFGQ